MLNFLLYHLRSQDVDPFDVKFTVEFDDGERDVDLPEEILLRGWMDVIKFLRELRVQGAEPVREARVFLLGEGQQGKTSLLLALKDTIRNLTGPIPLDDRTVGIDIEVFS